MDWKETFLKTLYDEKIHTDGDIEDFCDKHNLTYKEVYQFLAEIKTKNTSCEGCKYICNTIAYSPTYPCNCCVNYWGVSNKYEPISRGDE